MTVEEAYFVSGLDSNYPPGSDSISEGDNHLRLIKLVTKATFPNGYEAMNGIHTHDDEPTSTSAGQLWFDTTYNVLKIRNEADGAWVTLGASPVTDFKILGSNTVGWIPPTADGSPNQFLTTDGSGNLDWASAAGDELPSQTGHSGKYLTTDGSSASWAAVSGAQVDNISYFAGDASASVRSTSMTTAFSFTVTKASASTNLLLQVEAQTGLWNYGTSQTGSCQIYSATGTAVLGASVRCTGEWNNLGASASANNEVRGITSITRVDTTGLSAADHIFNVQFTSGLPSAGGTSIGEYNAVAWEIV